MITFQPKPHSDHPERGIIELWQGETFLGAIYPLEDGVKIVSKYFRGSSQVVLDISEEPYAVEVHLT